MSDIAFPYWSATRLAELNCALDEFPSPEYADGDYSDRFVALALGVDPKHSIWFWPEDKQREFYKLLQRLGLAEFTSAR